MPAPKSPIPDIGTASLRKTNRQVAYERALCINKSNFGKLNIYRLSPILEKKVATLRHEQRKIFPKDEKS